MGELCLRAVDMEVNMEAVKVEGQHVCPSCKVRMVEDRYERCAGCKAKWDAVRNSCVNHGWPEDLARARADDSYPPRCRV